MSRDPGANTSFKNYKCSPIRSVWDIRSLNFETFRLFSCLSNKLSTSPPNPLTARLQDLNTELSPAPSRRHCVWETETACPWLSRFSECPGPRPHPLPPSPEPRIQPVGEPGAVPTSRFPAPKVPSPVLSLLQTPQVPTSNSLHLKILPQQLRLHPRFRIQSPTPKPYQSLCAPHSHPESASAALGVRRRLPEPRAGLRPGRAPHLGCQARSRHTRGFATLQRWAGASLASRGPLAPASGSPSSAPSRAAIGWDPARRGARLAGRSRPCHRETDGPPALPGARDLLKDSGSSGAEGGGDSEPLPSAPPLSSLARRRHRSLKPSFQAEPVQSETGRRAASLRLREGGAEPLAEAASPSPRPGAAGGCCRGRMPPPKASQSFRAGDVARAIAAPLSRPLSSGPAQHFTSPPLNLRDPAAGLRAARPSRLSPEGTCAAGDGLAAPRDPGYRVKPLAFATKPFTVWPEAVLAPYHLATPVRSRIGFRCPPPPWTGSFL